MKSFFEALTAPRNATIAIIDRDATDPSEIRRAISNLAADLCAQRVAIHCDCALHFAIALAAVWQKGATAILPAHVRPGYLNEIGEQYDRLIDDDVVAEQLRQTPRTATRARALPIPDSGDCRALFFTSGSSGHAQAVAKTLQQLETEVATLESLWGQALAANARFRGLVSHQHIYGLLFRLLWPLMSGRPFQSRVIRYWEELPADPHGEDVLIASPAHLKRLPPAAHGKPAMIFCSGGALAYADAVKTEQCFGVLPCEVYGSTETGGIAWRRQHSTDTVWQPFPSVCIDQDDNRRLCVAGAHIVPPGGSAGDWFVTDDHARVATDKQSFTLLGRADRIVKIEGKRVSLEQVERHLTRSPLIDEVRLLTLSGRDHPLAAVARLSAPGQSLLRELGAFRLGRQLRRFLAEYEESAALPRYWRFVERIPRDTQAKYHHATLMALFDSPEPSTKTMPTIASRRVTADAVTLALHIDRELIYFQGHFAGLPVLPGLVQLHWACLKAAEHFQRPLPPVAIKQLKFKQVIVPDLDVRLELRKRQGQVHFQYESSHGIHSSGILQWRWR